MDMGWQKVGSGGIVLMAALGLTGSEISKGVSVFDSTSGITHSFPEGTSQEDITVAMQGYNQDRELVTKNKATISNDSYVKELSSFVKDFEGYSPIGEYITTSEKEEGIVTSGFGSTRRVKFGERVTSDQAEEHLQEELIEADTIVSRLVKIPLTQNERIAVTSLVFNVGEGSFAKSKALKALNKGDFDTFTLEAFDSERGFVRGTTTGEPLQGLVKRRNQERELFSGLATVNLLEVPKAL